MDVLSPAKPSTELQMSFAAGCCGFFGLFGRVLEVVHDFVYLGSTISDTISLDVKLDKHIGKAATMFSRPVVLNVGDNAPQGAISFFRGAVEQKGAVWGRWSRRGR